VREVQDADARHHDCEQTSIEARAVACSNVRRRFGRLGRHGPSFSTSAHDHRNEIGAVYRHGGSYGDRRRHGDVAGLGELCRTDRDELVIAGREPEVAVRIVCAPAAEPARAREMVRRRVDDSAVVLWAAL